MDTIKLAITLILTGISLCHSNGSTIMLEKEVTTNASLIASSNIDKPFFEEQSGTQLVMNIDSSNLKGLPLVTPLATTNQISPSLVLPIAKDNASYAQRYIGFSQSGYIKVEEPSYIALATVTSLIVISIRKRRKAQRT